MKKWSGLISVVLLLHMFIDGADSKLKKKAKEKLKNCHLGLQRPCPDPINFKFHLFTSQNPEASQRVHVTARRDNLHRTFFNPSLPNKVIIHGFSPRQYRTQLVSIKDAYLSQEETNMWMVDWSRLANGGTCRVLSMQNLNHVARCTAQLIAAIDRRAPLAEIHVVAESVGVRVAHLLAVEISPLRLTRITGLNPEGGTLPTGIDTSRLSPWDADFVDTIHTVPFLPRNNVFGDVDFYVNPSSFHQPGCEKKKKGKFTCDLARALEYFAESITTDVGFLGWHCPSYTQYTLGTCNPQGQSLTMGTMGDMTPVTASGIYLVYTAKESPYALGHWEGKMFKEKGPKLRNDVISKVSRGVKGKLQLLEKKAPRIAKELGFVDFVKRKLDDKANDFKALAFEKGKQKARSFATGTKREEMNDDDQEDS